MPTELDTVNRMLSAAGLAPVADASTQHPSYKRARTKLLQVSATIQSSGYWFNKSAITLQPTVEGKVYVPQKAVHVNTTEDADKAVVMRGPLMYDLDNRTYILSRDIKAVMIEVLDFNVLPMPVADFIAARAVMEFFVDQGGQDPKLSMYRLLANEAEIKFKKEVLANHRPIQPSWRRTRTWNNIYARYE
jgi:hypothetical protein